MVPLLLPQPVHMPPAGTRHPPPLHTHTHKTGKPTHTSNTHVHAMPSQGALTPWPTPVEDRSGGFTHTHAHGLRGHTGGAAGCYARTCYSKSSQPPALLPPEGRGPAWLASCAPRIAGMVHAPGTTNKGPPTRREKDSMPLPSPGPTCCCCCCCAGRALVGRSPCSTAHSWSRIPATHTAQGSQPAPPVGKECAALAASVGKGVHVAGRNPHPRQEILQPWEEPGVVGPGPLQSNACCLS